MKRCPLVSVAGAVPSLFDRGFHSPLLVMPLVYVLNDLFGLQPTVRKIQERLGLLFDVHLCEPGATTLSLSRPAA